MGKKKSRKELFVKKNFKQSFPIFLQNFRHWWMSFQKNLTFSTKSPTYLFYGDGLFNPRIFLITTNNFKIVSQESVQSDLTNYFVKESLK